METIYETLMNAVYFSLNPLVWVAAIMFAVRSGKLRNPVIAAVTTQSLFGGLLIATTVLSDRVIPISDILVVALFPAVLSGLLVSSLVILFTKRRLLRRRLSSWQIGRLAYK